MCSQLGHNKWKCPFNHVNTVYDSDVFDFHELFEGEGQGQRQGHGASEFVVGDLEEEVGCDEHRVDLEVDDK